MSPQEILNSFYIAYWAWLQDGAPETANFQRRLGLCTNLWHYSHDSEAMLLLYEQFKDAKLDINYPFDDGCLEYFVYQDQKKLHTNPKRIEWVRNKVSQLIF